METRRLWVRIPLALLEKLKKYAGIRGRSLSGQATWYIEKGIAREEHEELTARRGGTKDHGEQRAVSEVSTGDVESDGGAGGRGSEDPLDPWWEDV